MEKKSLIQQREEARKAISEFKMPPHLSHLRHNKPGIVKFAWHGRKIDLRTVSVKIADAIADDESCGVLCRVEKPATKPPVTPPEDKSGKGK